MMSWIVAILLVLAMIAGASAVFSWIVQRGVERALPPRGRFLEVNGQRVHFLDIGEGPPIVFVHGLGGQIGNFTYSLAAQLADRYRLILIDRPGSGYSTRPPDAACNLRAQAETIAQVIAGLGLQQPLVVGHSLGGAISLALAADHPQAVRALALIAPLTQLQEEVPAAFRLLAITSPLLRTFVAWTLSVPLGILRGRQVLATVFAPEPVPADYATTGYGLLGLRPTAFYGSSSDMVAVKTDMAWLVSCYPTLSVPAGILYGTKDHVIDYRVHGLRTAEQIPGLRLQLVPGGGHMLPVTQPDATAHFIASFAATPAVPTKAA